MKLDNIDRRILRSLQRNGRLQNVELAKEIGLSPSPCLRRVKLLEESGVINRYVALLSPHKVNKGLIVYARVWLTIQSAEIMEQFIYEVKLLPEIMECYVMAGECDFMLRIIATDLEDYRRFQVNYLSRIKGVQTIKTEIPLQVIKNTTEIQL